MSADGDDQPPLSIEVQARSDDTVGLIVAGEIDASNAQRIYDAVLIVTESSGLADVELDLAAVTFMDSSGLSALIKAASILRDRHGNLTLCDPSAPAARLLEVTGLTNHLLEREL